MAFFPALPVVSRLVAAATGLGLRASMLLVSNAALLAAYVFFWAYLLERPPPDGSSVASADRRTVSGYGLLSLAWFLPNHFHHVAYSESLLLLGQAAFLWSIQRHAAVWKTALVVGLTTATRPPGAALVIPFAFIVLKRWFQGSLGIASACAALGLSVCGIAAYAGCLWWRFGSPLAFAANQAYWVCRPPVPASFKVPAVAALLPVWEVFIPASPAYWANHGPRCPLLNWQFANAAVFLLACGLVGWGAAARRLTGIEAVLAVGLLLIPYVTKGFDNCMFSQARFGGAVLPIYIVLGHLLSRLPTAVSGSLVALSAVLQSVFAMNFSARGPVF